MNPTTSSCRRCCVREKGARRPAHGDDTLSRWPATERKAGARCPVHGRVRYMQAYVLRAQMTSWLTLFTQTGSRPSRRPACAPPTNRPQHRCETRNEPAGQANIERLRETDLRDRHRNGIAGNGVHRPAAGSQGEVRSPEFARVVRKAGSRTGIYEGSSQAEFARWYLRRGQSRSGVARRNSRVDPARRASRAQKSAAPKNGALPRTTTGANQIRPES